MSTEVLVTLETGNASAKNRQAFRFDLDDRTFEHTGWARKRGMCKMQWRMTLL